MRRRPADRIPVGHPPAGRVECDLRIAGLDDPIAGMLVLRRYQFEQEYKRRKIARERRAAEQAQLEARYAAVREAELEAKRQRLLAGEPLEPARPERPPVLELDPAEERYRNDLRRRFHAASSFNASGWPGPY